MKEFARNVVISFAAGKLNTDWICGHLYACDYKYKKLELDDYALDVLKDKPAN